jgi:high-affinity nickel-transport protein
VSVSASVLFVLAVVNTFILYRILRKRRRAKKGLEPEESQPAYGCIARAVRPLLKLIDKPWKLYPIGILFSFGCRLLLSTDIIITLTSLPSRHLVRNRAA